LVENFSEGLFILERGGGKVKAAVLKDKRCLSVEEVPNPRPGPGEVLVKVSYCAVCGSDIYRFVTGQGIGLILGHEFCGKIVEIGEGIKEWSIDDSVTVDPITQCNSCYSCLHDQGNLCPNRGGTATPENPGGYGEYTKAKAIQLFHAPEGVEEKELTIAQPLAVALHALRQSKMKIGDSVIVIGAGPIGLLVLACARLAGASKVYVVEKAAGRKEAARRSGADAVLHPSEINSREQLLELTGIGADVVFGCAGNQQAVRDSLTLSRAGGMVVIVGNHWTTEIYSDIVEREVTVKGSKAYLRREFGEAVDLIANGRINCEALITNVEPLSDIQRVFEELQEPTTQVKTLIVT